MGVGGVHHEPGALLSGRTPVPTEQEPGLFAEPVGTFWRGEKFLPRTGFKPLNVQSVDESVYDCAVPAPGQDLDLGCVLGLILRHHERVN
jgi:hypothetical protein